MKTKILDTELSDNATTFLKSSEGKDVNCQMLNHKYVTQPLKYDE